MRGGCFQGAAGQRGQAPKMPSGCLSPPALPSAVRGLPHPAWGPHRSLARVSASHLGNGLCWWPEVTRITCKLGPPGPLQGRWACEGHSSRNWVEWMPCASARAHSRWTWVWVFLWGNHDVPHLADSCLAVVSWYGLSCCAVTRPSLSLCPLDSHSSPLRTCLTCRHLVSCLGNLLSSALWTGTVLAAKRGHRHATGCAYKARGGGPAQQTGRCSEPCFGGPRESMR